MHPPKIPGHRPAKSGLPRSGRCGNDEQQPFFFKFHLYFTAERAEAAEKYMEKYIKLKSKFCLSFWGFDLSVVNDSDNLCALCDLCGEIAVK